MKHRSIGTCSWKCQISVDVAFFNSSEFYWARRCQAYNQPGGISVQTYCTPTKTRRCDGVRVSYILKETGDPSPIIKQYSALQRATARLKPTKTLGSGLCMHGFAFITNYIVYIISLFCHQNQFLLTLGVETTNISIPYFCKAIFAIFICWKKGCGMVHILLKFGKIPYMFNYITERKIC